MVVVVELSELPSEFVVSVCVTSDPDASTELVSVTLLVAPDASVLVVSVTLDPSSLVVVVIYLELVVMNNIIF